MNPGRLASGLLFAGIAAVVAQGFALPQAVLCVREAAGACTERYVSVFTGFVGAGCLWTLVFGGLRSLAARISPLPLDRALWVAFGGTTLATLAFFARALPYHEVIAVSAIPYLFICLQERVWRFDAGGGPRPRFAVGIADAFLFGSAAYLVAGAVIQGSPRAAEVWWAAVVRVGYPTGSLAGAAFSGAAVTAFLVCILKPPRAGDEPGDLLSAGVVLAGAAVFGFSARGWLQSALPTLFEDPVAESVATAFGAPGALAVIAAIAGVAALLGAVAAFRARPIESAALLFFGGPVLGIACDHLAREWLYISGDYPLTGPLPHPSAIALLAVSRALWIYPFIGFFIAVRARTRRALLSRWLPSVGGLVFAALAAVAVRVLLLTETYERLRFQLDYFRLREDFALIGIPLLAAGWLFPGLRTRVRKPRPPSSLQARTADRPSV
jgi:hypothetical protein